MFTRIGLIGDIHAEDATLNVALNFLHQDDSIDHLLCVGDIVTGPGDAAVCCRLLREAEVATVRGNHDRWFLNNSRGLGGYLHLPRATSDYDITGEDRVFLETLPVTREIETSAGLLLLSHGTGDDDTSGIYPDDSLAALESNHRLHSLLGECKYHFIVSGHTHERMVRRINHLSIINPGYLRRDLRPGFGIADFITGRIQFYDIDPDTLEVVASEMFSL
jgi:putative phosphoesterase